MVFGGDKVSREDYNRLFRDKAQLNNELSAIQAENNQLKHQLELALSKATETNQLRTQVRQIQEELERKKRTIDGLQEAVRRWRCRAGKDKHLPKKSELVKSEYKMISGEWLYLEHRTIADVDDDPSLARIAWENMDCLNRKVCRSIYFDSRFGWVMILERKW